MRTLGGPAPPAALDSPCAEGSYRADFGAAARSTAVTSSPAESQARAPITVFVVRDVLGKAGCSLGPLVDHVTVDMSALAGTRLRVLAHEPATPAASPIPAQRRI